MLCFIMCFSSWHFVSFFPLIILSVFLSESHHPRHTDVTSPGTPGSRELPPLLQSSQLPQDFAGAPNGSRVTAVRCDLYGVGRWWRAAPPGSAASAIHVLQGGDTNIFFLLLGCFFCFYHFFASLFRGAMFPSGLHEAGHPTFGRCLMI